jgi:selenocysteine lyase/cysteine desulfurase
MTLDTRPPTLDVARLREQFPVLAREMKPGVPLVYLDSTATSQKPLAVIEAMDVFYRLHNANIHRGVYQLAEEATAQFEAARARVAAPSDRSELMTVAPARERYSAWRRRSAFHRSRWRSWTLAMTAARGWMR